MQLKNLELAHVRVFDQAEFEFQPGMNLLVGINGAGKSTVLDVLRIILSRMLPKFTAYSSKRYSLTDDDVEIGHDSLEVDLTFNTQNTPFSCHLKKNFGDKTHFTFKPTNKKVLEPLKTDPIQPLALYFSTRRSVPSDRQPSKRSSAGGQAAAFAEALVHRELRIREFAEWMLAQEALAAEVGEKAIRRLEALDKAVTSFLDGYTNLRAVKEQKPTLLVDKNSSTLNVRQLSDGERSMVALVLDLARRLAQANPKSDDPLRDGKAVILIDELDLHMHPSWQRTICDRLTATFPNCQFIATTHSPQIIGEVPRDNILIIEEGKTYRPAQSLGMDSNWILRYLMGEETRNAATMHKLKEIEDLIEAEQYDEATTAIDSLRGQVGEFPELVSLQTRIDMIEFLSNQEYGEESE